MLHLDRVHWGKSAIVLVLSLLWVSPAAAQATKGTGRSFTSSDYRVDLFEGPVLSSARVNGMAGSYGAIAEGVDGYGANAAAPAVRLPYSTSHFDYDFAIGAGFPGVLADLDFFNERSRTVAYRGYIMLNGGLNVQVGRWGFGVTVDSQSFELIASDGRPEQLHVGIQRIKALVGTALLDGQLLLGAGLRVAVLSFTESTIGSRILFSTASDGFEAGAIWAPQRNRIRVGLTARAPMSKELLLSQLGSVAPDANGNVMLDGRYVPNSVEIPWEIEASVALQLGARPLSPRWTDPEQVPTPSPLPPLVGNKDPEAARRAAVRNILKKRYESYPRDRLLIVFTGLVSGDVRNAVSLQSVLTQQVTRSGEYVSFTPRIGLEGEPIAHWLQLRGGLYLEPSRTAGSFARLHTTAGMDVKVGRWNLFGFLDDDTMWHLRGYVDVARDYFSFGGTVGIWH